MYSFDFLKNEELIDVFEDVWIAQEDNEKNTTIALTNQRLLFLDYNRLDPREDLRVGRGAEYVRFKEVYYSISLDNIKTITNKKDVYIIEFRDGNKPLQIDNNILFNLIKKEIKK